MTPATTIPGFSERFAEVKGARLRYLVAGAGPPVLLVHGLGGAAANWIELAPALARRRSVLVPELPGHGASSPLPAVAGLDAFAERIGLLLAREEFLPAAVVGHSLGGVVGLRLALRRPEAISALVLAASAGIASASRRAAKALALLSLVRPARHVAPHRRRVARSLLLRYLVFGYWGASDPSSLSPRAVEGFLAPPALHTDTASAASALVRDDPRSDLGDVRCPCLVLSGARDQQTPVDDAFEYARRLGARLRVIPDCGHLLIGERPDACLDAIERFLDSVEARS